MSESEATYIPINLDLPKDAYVDFPDDGEDTFVPILDHLYGTRRRVANPGRGGARPGAGAPKGNTNALRTGMYSPRYRGVIDLLLIVPVFMDTLRAEKDPARRKVLAGEYREAARWVFDNTPFLTENLEAIINTNLKGRTRKVPLGHSAILMLERDPGRRGRFGRACMLASFLSREDRQLHDALTRYVLSCFAHAPGFAPRHRHLEKNAKFQSNNQTSRRQYMPGSLVPDRH